MAVVTVVVVAAEIATAGAVAGLQSAPVASPGIVTARNTATVQTPGGSGGLSIAGHLLARSKVNARVYVSDPTWPNHIPLLKMSGLELEGDHVLFTVEGEAEVAVRLRFVRRERARCKAAIDQLPHPRMARRLARLVPPGRTARPARRHRLAARRPGFDDLRSSSLVISVPDLVDALPCRFLVRRRLVFQFAGRPEGT